MTIFKRRQGYASLPKSEELKKMLDLCVWNNRIRNAIVEYEWRRDVAKKELRQDPEKMALEILRKLKNNIPLTDYEHGYSQNCISIEVKI